MNINTISPGQAQAVPETAGQAPPIVDASQPKGEQQAVQESKSLKVDLMVNGALSELLKNLAGTVKNSEALLKSLPAMLQQEIQRLMGQMAPDTTILSQGMTAITQGQRGMMEKLQYIFNSLQGAAVIQQQASPETVKSLADKINTYIATLEQQVSTLNQAGQGPAQVFPGAAKGTTTGNGTVPFPANDLAAGQAIDTAPQKSKPEEPAVTRQENNSANPAGLTDRGKTTRQDMPASGGKNIIPPEGGESPLQEVVRAPFPAEKNTATVWMDKFQTVMVKQGNYDQVFSPRELGELLAQYNDMTKAEQQAIKQLLNTVPTGTFPAKQPEQLLQFLSKNQVVLPEQPQEESGAAKLITLLKNELTENVQAITGNAVKTIESGTIKLPAMVNTETVVLLAKALVGEGSVPVELRNALATVAVVSKDEQDVVNRVSSYFQTGMPQVVIQASTQFDLPELPDLWVLMKFRSAAEWADLPAETLQKAIHTVKEFSTSMQNAVAAYTERSDNSNTLSFTLPLCFGNGETVYPAYVRIYHEKDKAAGNSLQQAETWLRIFFDTDYIGSVNLIFHMYQGDMLSVRTEFSSDVVAQAFQQQMDDLRSTLSDLPIHLADFSIRTMPEETL